MPLYTVPGIDLESPVPEKTWRDFPVKWPPPQRGGDDRCMEFDEVTHVAHVKDALRIIEDGRIRSSLVYDDSCLNRKRTQVSWVSPKTWYNGYIYGNVAFAFDWAELMDGMKTYWVEHRRTNRQQLCRFLICEDEFTDPPLEEYDYTKPHGPLYYDRKADKWYHNNDVTSEYMILDDLSMRLCNAVRFVLHHPRYCNKSGPSCPHLGRSDSEAGAEVICKLIGAGRRRCARLFESRDAPGEIDSSVDGAVSRMYRRTVGKFDVSRKGRAADSDRNEIMKAILMAAGWRQKDRVAALLAQFPNERSVEEVFYACLDEFFKGLKVSRE